MKHFLFYTISLLCFSGYSRGVSANYQILKSQEDKTLKKTESVFVLTFFNTKAQIVEEEITFSYNKLNKKQKSDARGSIILNTKPGKYLFKFLYNLKHYEIITDSILIKPGFRTEIQVNVKSSTEPVIAFKPVIYVYPKQKEDVSIKLDLNGEFTFTYPQYSNGWHFTASPDGTILMGEKKYHYLFWDGKLNIEPDKLNLTEGFVVNKNNLVKFFEEKLSLMGLNSQEINDYITFWCPRMNENEKNYIHFMFNEEYNDYASININPKPDQLFRVFMLWSKANTDQIKEQKIETFTRRGFTVVEWGGTEINYKINLLK